MKKNWNDPELRNLGVDATNEGDDCQENVQGELAPACICAYYHSKMMGGCGGCQAPYYLCKLTGKNPKFTKKCECGTPSEQNPSS